MNVVLDTNVIISALLNPKGTPGKILNAGIDETIHLVSSARLFHEFERTLAYPHIQKHIKESWAEHELRSFLLSLRHVIKFVFHGPPQTDWIPQDPDDNWVVACAMAGKAEYLVSGDQHLLALGAVDAIHIVTPAEFLKIIIG